MKDLEEAPVQLLPDILDAIKRYYEFASEWNNKALPALSIVFEVMRRWDEVFSLYEAVVLGKNRAGKRMSVTVWPEQEA